MNATELKKTHVSYVGGCGFKVRPKTSYSAGQCWDNALNKLSSLIPFDLMALTLYVNNALYGGFSIYRTIILPVVLCGCETWSLTLREERRLRVFENRVLRRVFGPKRDEVTAEWKKLHNEELDDLLLTQYCAGGKIETNEMGRACGAYGGG